MKDYFIYLFYFVLFLMLAFTSLLLTVVGLIVYKHPIQSVGFVGVGIFFIFAFASFSSMQDSFEKIIEECKKDGESARTKREDN